MYKIYLEADEAWDSFQRNMAGIRQNDAVIIAANMSNDARIYLCNYENKPEIYAYVGEEQKYRGIYSDRERLRDDLIYLFDAYIETSPVYDDEGFEEDYDGSYVTYDSEDFEDDEDECEDDESDEDYEVECDPGEAYIYAYDLLNAVNPGFASLPHFEQEELINEVLTNIAKIPYAQTYF